MLQDYNMYTDLPGIFNDANEIQSIAHALRDEKATILSIKIAEEST